MTETPDKPCQVGGFPPPLERSSTEAKILSLTDVVFEDLERGYVGAVFVHIDKCGMMEVLLTAKNVNLPGIRRGFKVLNLDLPDYWMCNISRRSSARDSQILALMPVYASKTVNAPSWQQLPYLLRVGLIYSSRTAFISPYTIRDHMQRAVSGIWAPYYA